ncbi:MAG: hypothetical protein ACTSPV_19180, partial [Candidatus Hodarchaeales archaeon]
MGHILKQFTPPLSLFRLFLYTPENRKLPIILVMFDFIVTDITIEDLIIDTRVAATVLTGVFAIVLLIRSRKEQSLIKRKGLFWAGILFQLLVVNLILIGYYELDTYSLFFEYGSLGLITLIPLL